MHLSQHHLLMQVMHWCLLHAHLTVSHWMADWTVRPFATVTRLCAHGCYRAQFLRSDWLDIPFVGCTGLGITSFHCVTFEVPKRCGCPTLLEWGDSNPTDYDLWFATFVLHWTVSLEISIYCPCQDVINCMHLTAPHVLVTTPFADAGHALVFVACPPHCVAFIWLTGL